MLECVVNVSEGKDRGVLDDLAAAAGACLLDVHTDAFHGRSVFTLAGHGVQATQAGHGVQATQAGIEAAVRALVAEGVRRVDLGRHAGVHPRLGAVDVVPFVPLAGSTLADAIGARDRFATWAADTLGVPCFLYGPERSLPDVRRHAFRTLVPDTGPPGPHPTAGAICAGARPVLIAYNLWLVPGVPTEVARRVAEELRGPAVRALGFDVGGRAQVSLNLVDPAAFGPAEAYDAVAARAPVERAELVGLLPGAVLDAIPPERWNDLDVERGRTIEARLERSQSRNPRLPLRPTPRSRGAASAPAGGGDGAAPAR